MIGSFRIDLVNATSGEVEDTYPITSATQVTRRRILDRIGKWSFDMSTSDPALSDIEGKDFKVYWLQGDETYYIGQCSYLNHAITAPNVVTVNASGTLRDLTRQTVLQRSFDGSADDVNDVLDTIVPLRSGWSLGDVDTIATAAPMDFWYETVFDGIALLAETFGYHFREGTASKTLDFGAMGVSSGILAIGVEI